jgi:hypothetical protein
VQHINKIENIDTRNGPVDKREISLIDSSGFSISCTLWGKNVSVTINQF